MMIPHERARISFGSLTRASSRRRRGITIIETMVVMTGVAAMLGLCAVTIQLLLRLNSDGQARLSASVALDRLASQFREDVHACDDAQLVAKAQSKPAPAEPAASLRLTLGTQHVVAYEAREGRVDRIESGPGAARRHESYRLDRGSAVRFERRDDGPRRFVAMVMTRHASEPVESHRTLEVLAVQGKDRFGPSRQEGGRAR